MRTSSSQDPARRRKVRQGLSAGRVQSVATRLVVERERERIAFRTVSDRDRARRTAARSIGEGNAFDARLVGVDGKRVATGRDFGRDGKPVARFDGVHLDEGDRPWAGQCAAGLGVRGPLGRGQAL